VAENDHSKLPLFYRISAVWGAHEGSLLLWALILGGWTLAVAIASRGLPLALSGLVLAVLGVVASGFQLFILLTSNPFVRLFPVPDEGRDLNPILQDPGLAVHPPMLYMGYVGFAVAFAFAIAALISGRLDAAWARWTRPWTTTAWMFLTMGITLGSWWAYKELGWGGWWFWDPVENASFMPWLAGTALIHSLAVTEKRGLLKSWTVLLALLAFSLSLLGTFLVRSGVLVSVHAFASDPTRGLYILCFLGLVVGAALSLYAWRAPKLVADGPLELFSREGLLLLNNLFLVVACAAVLLGTLYPLVLDSLKLGKISVGPPYFNTVFVPLFAPLLLLVGLTAAISWKRASGPELRKRLQWPAAIALIGGIALPLALYARAPTVALAGSLLGVWTMIAAAQEAWRRIRSRPGFMDGVASVPRAVWGMTLAHVGLGVWAIGVSFVTAYGAEQDVRLAPGASADLGGYTFRFESADEIEGANYRAQTAHVRVTRNGRDVTELTPQKRLFPSQGTVLSISAIDAGVLRDLYVALGQGYDDGSWSLRVYVKPMVREIWFGGVLMFIGGLIAASDRRYRLAAQARAAAAGAVVAAG
jgi:cytochrome c-type biogenesis protein CcmF